MSIEQSKHDAHTRKVLLVYGYNTRIQSIENTLRTLDTIEEALLTDDDKYRLHTCINKAKELISEIGQRIDIIKPEIKKEGDLFSLNMCENTIDKEYAAGVSKI